MGPFVFEVHTPRDLGSRAFLPYNNKERYGYGFWVPGVPLRVHMSSEMSQEGQNEGVYIYIILAMCMVCKKKTRNKQLNYFDSKILQQTNKQTKKNFKIRAKLGVPW